MGGVVGVEQGIKHSNKVNVPHVSPPKSGWARKAAIAGLGERMNSYVRTVGIRCPRRNYYKGSRVPADPYIRIPIDIEEGPGENEG